MGLFSNEEEEREKRRAEEARERTALHKRFEAEAEMRKAEIEATRDKSFEMAERAEGVSEIKQIRRIAKSDKGDAIVELIQRYEGFDNSEVSSDSIRQLILSYNPPTDMDGIRLFFQTLFVNEDYIKKFIEKQVSGNDPSESEFYQFWEKLNKRGDVAWDQAFRDYEHVMTDEEKVALEEIRLLKKSTGVEVLQKMMIYYDRFSDPMAHGSRNKKDMSPAAQEALEYIMKHDAPTEYGALEEYADYVLNNEDDFDTLQARHGLLFTQGIRSKTTEYTDIGRDFKYGRETLYAYILRKIDKAIKAGNYKKVTTGAIGQRNAKNRKTRNMYIGCAVIAAIFIILMIIAIASEE